MAVKGWVWALFAFLVLGMLALDLLVGRGSRGQGRALTLRSAALWSAAWIGLGLLFSFVILGLYGPRAQLTYLTAYLLEKSLSVDNIFVFVLIFSQLEIPPAEQRRVLYWGVVGALVMRGALIAGGMYLLARFHWVVYVFAALIILAAVRMLFGGETERKAVAAACVVCGTWVARILPITPALDGGRFWVRQGGRFLATPLLVALMVVETTDLVFAMDSIPAVFALTREPFLVYTSNIFAMLGLRSLYFLLAGAVDRFRYLRFGLAAVLLFVGVKMLLGDLVEVPTWVSLAVIAVALTLAVTVSIIVPPKRARLAGPGARLAATPGRDAIPASCTHLGQVRDAPPRTPGGCEECLATGKRWVHLRLCLTCGHVGCCDSSPGKHATGHYHQASHPLMRSFEPGEDWGWCYVDELTLRPAPHARAPASRVAGP